MRKNFDRVWILILDNARVRKAALLCLENRLNLQAKSYKGLDLACDEPLSSNAHVSIELRNDSIYC